MKANVTLPDEAREHYCVLQSLLISLKRPSKGSRHAIRRPGVVLTASLIAACAQQAPAPPPKPDEAAIRAALDAQLAKISQILAKKDAAGVATMFTDDAVWILPG